MLYLHFDFFHVSVFFTSITYFPNFCSFNVYTLPNTHSFSYFHRHNCHSCDVIYFIDFSMAEGPAADAGNNNYQAENQRLFKDKSLLQEPWMECLEKPDAFIVGFCFPCCGHAVNWALASEGDDRVIRCILAICCSFFLCGLIRSHNQKAVGVEDDGIVWNCLMHLTCLCSPCSLVQEYRALLNWKRATDSTFASKYNDDKYWWDVGLIAMQ